MRIITLLLGVVLLLATLRLVAAYRSRSSVVAIWLKMEDDLGVEKAKGVMKPLFAMLIGQALYGMLVGVLGDLGSDFPGMYLMTDIAVPGALVAALALVLKMLSSLWRVSRKGPTNAIEAPYNDRPPQFAEYLLYYLPKKIREPLLGDLEEEYREISARFGRRKATTWYYVQVVLSYWPLLCSGVKKLVKWGVLGWIGGVVRRLIS